MCIVDVGRLLIDTLSIMVQRDLFMRYFYLLKEFLKYRKKNIRMAFLSLIYGKCENFKITQHVMLHFCNFHRRCSSDNVRLIRKQMGLNDGSFDNFDNLIYYEFLHECS